MVIIPTLAKEPCHMPLDTVGQRAAVADAEGHATPPPTTPSISQTTLIRLHPIKSDSPPPAAPPLSLQGPVRHTAGGTRGGGAGVVLVQPRDMRTLG
ncbi:unnamed protein product [Gadus morhua 'NCC']